MELVWEGLVLVDRVYVYPAKRGVREFTIAQDSLVLSCCYLIFVVVTDARAIALATGCHCVFLRGCVCVCVPRHASFAIVAACKPWFLPSVFVIVAEVALSIILAFCPSSLHPTP